MKTLLIIITLFFSLATSAQHVLQPGFDAREYGKLLTLYFHGKYASDSLQKAEGANAFKRTYRSPEVGLKNQWSLYENDNGMAIISIRGTVGDKVSWLANFYAAMIPATGALQLSGNKKMHYKLSADSMAAVHTGWTVALCAMAPDIVEKINGLYKKGTKDFYIFGHSQGGAIAYLLRSYLHYLQQDGELPKDILFKTYCSAAPKPGNMYYAYDFEYITRGGWAYTVVNRADWVPESPYTIQRIQDMNAVNPLINTKKLLKKQKFFVRLVGGTLFRKVNRKPRKAQKMYTRYLGNTIYKIAVKKAMPGFEQPAYIPSNNYMRAGNPVVLLPDDAYNKIYKDEGKDYFLHHHFAPYYYLLKKQYY